MKRAHVRLLLIFTVIVGILQTRQALAGDDDWLDRHTTFWNGKAKIGGELRLRVESFDDFDRIFNDAVNAPDRNDDFLLSRVRLSLDLRPSEILRLYLQLQDSHQFETDVPTAFRIGPGAREDRVDIHQAFVDVKPVSHVPLTFRVGRQEMNYGVQRLVGGFGWSNVGRSFQGVKAMFDTEEFFVDAFGVDVVIPEDGHFNDADTKDDFYGVYGGWKKFPTGVLEAYVLYRDNDRLNREIYTFGTRLAGHLLESQAVDYSVEVAFQTGDFAKGLDQKALAAHAAAGYTFKNCPATPRLGAEYNFSTGDEDPDDGKNETFDNLFPTNHPHYGYMDLFSWRNMHNLRLNATTRPLEGLTLKCDLHFFWLDETTDAWFNAGGGVVRPGRAERVDDFVGEELDLTASYEVNKHLAFVVGYSHFFTGEFVRDTGPSDDADWVYLQTTLSF